MFNLDRQNSGNLLGSKEKLLPTKSISIHFSANFTRVLSIYFIIVENIAEFEPECEKADSR